MDVRWLRFIWSASVGVVAAWFSGGSDLEPRALPALLVAALVAYFVWPAFAPYLPRHYTLGATLGSVVVVLLIGFAYALVPVIWGGEPIAIPVLAGRFAVMALATVALGIVLSVLGARFRNR